MHAFAEDTAQFDAGFIFQGSGKKSYEYLGVQELYGLNLNADLAILSACETGYGNFVEGLGVMSMGRAFKYAGCDGIVMSLWKADDEVSAVIIQSFFKYLKQGKERGEALRLAKLDYLNTNPLKAHPFFWANFIVIGENEPVDIQHNYTMFWWLAIVLISVGAGLFYIFKTKQTKYSTQKRA